MKSVVLKRGRDHSARMRHPWVFSRAIEMIDDGVADGETVVVVAQNGEPLGVGSWSGSSQIAVRMWSFDPKQSIGEAFFRERLAEARRSRSHLLDSGCTNAYRLVNAESDGLPGIIVDVYGDFAVCQFSTAGADRAKADMAKAVVDVCGVRGVFERSDSDGRGYEGLEKSVGPMLGEEPPEKIEIFENGCKFLVDVRNGHKTGFYLDQRDNRAKVASFAKGRDVLNVFSYTGGFGVAALAHGAKSVTHLDLSAGAMALARENTRLNGLDEAKSEFIEGDAFKVLRTFRDSRRDFDMIVLDPPKFADSKSRLMGACRGYKDVNLLAMKLLRKGGILATFSCSGLMTPDLFRKIVGEAALDSGRNVRIFGDARQAGDHPEGAAFPEGLYLKGLICEIE